MLHTCAIETLTHGRYLVDEGDSEGRPAPGNRGGAAERRSGSAADRPLLVGFHGYAENAERHLEQLRTVPGSRRWVLASVQALHRFYNRQDEIVASWMTRQDRELAIADNIAYVDAVVAAVRSAYRATGPLVFAGFSQGVAMAFRAARLGWFPCAGVIALGGDIPPDVRSHAQGTLPRVLLGRGESDSWYTDEKLAADIACLEAAGGGTPEVVRFAGGHEWTDAFRREAGRFLDAILTET